MKWLVAVLTAFFQALLPWPARRSRPSAEDADPDRDTREKLRAKISKTWGKRWDVRSSKSTVTVGVNSAGACGRPTATSWPTVARATAGSRMRGRPLRVCAAFWPTPWSRR